MAIHKLIAANVKEGEDFRKLSLIFILTINPATIKIHKPMDANKSKIG